MLTLLLATLQGATAFSVVGRAPHMPSSSARAASLAMQAAAPAPAKAGEGLQTITLSNAAGDSATIYKFGACVTSYTKGGVDYLQVRPDAKLDGSKPISGGIPFCFPQFGPGAIQQHGFRA